MSGRRQEKPTKNPKRTPRSSQGVPTWHGDDGTTTIQANGHQFTLEWSQLGSDSGFQDVRQLLKEIVLSLQQEGDQFAHLGEDKIMLQCAGSNSCMSLDPDATLVGDEGKATRNEIKKAGDLEVWPAAAAKRSRGMDKLPAKPRYHLSDYAEAVPKSGHSGAASFSLFPGTKAFLVIDEDTVGTDKWEVQYDRWKLGRQPAWRPFSDERVQTERSAMVYLTLSRLKPGQTYSFRLRGIKKGKAPSAWGQVRTPVRMAASKQSSTPAPAAARAAPATRAAAPAAAAAADDDDDDDDDDDRPLSSLVNTAPTPPPRAAAIVPAPASKAKTAPAPTTPKPTPTALPAPAPAPAPATPSKSSTPALMVVVPVQQQAAKVRGYNFLRFEP